MGLWTAPNPLLLASASAVRRMLLEAAGLPVETKPADLDERALQTGMGVADASAIALRLAVAKAAMVAARHPDRIVVGADQVLACDGDLFAKPGDAAAARRHLARLAGRPHVLHAGVAVAAGGAIVRSFVATARLHMRALDEAAIGRYLDRAGEAALRSVGAYEIEGLGIHLFDAIEGEHSTILGLPMIPLLKAFRELGLIAL